MSRNVPIPFFPSPPQEYSQSYFSQLVRNFAVFAQQTQVPGPLRATELTLTTDTGNVDTGILSYNIDEDTIDLQHLNGVVQQIGFETFMRCANNTGVLIPEGTIVGFTGVNGEIKIAPYIADGTSPEVFFIGVTTFDMEDGDVGPVTIYGKVRQIDTTGTSVGESWAVGDVLYASPTIAGGLTRVRPTAPNKVIVVAAVLSVDATEGDILVRPTIPIGLKYGFFASTVNQTISATNTATPITFNTTEIASAVSIGTPASRIVVTEAGFYTVTTSVQLLSTSSASKQFYLWLSKNGTDVNNTTRNYTISANNQNRTISATYPISLQAGDYIELKWAGDNTAMRLNAVNELVFAPSAPSVVIAVTQIQL